MGYGIAHTRDQLQAGGQECAAGLSRAGVVARLSSAVLLATRGGPGVSLTRLTGDASALASPLGERSTSPQASPPEQLSRRIDKEQAGSPLMRGTRPLTGGL